ncbi:MAG TPA: acetyl-CoA hydrolase/transferase C-terminal domain-containing protein [Candidatus Binatia bacterium]|jgi:acyl-CoA hydrolase
MSAAYRARLRSPAEAAALLRPRDTLCVPLGPGQPGAFLDALGARDDWQQLEIFAGLLLAPHSVLFHAGVRVLSGFFGPVERAIRDQGMDVRFVPADFRRFAPAMRKLAPRVVATVVCPPDASGRMSLGLHAGASVDEMHRAGADQGRVLVAEINPYLPRTFGIGAHDHSLSIDEVDVIVESELPLPVLPESEPSPVELAIAANIRPFVSDGMTLQTGIGAVPSTVVEILASGGGGDYGIHSEMFTTGLMKLHESGKISNRKGVYDGFSISTFALGTEALHRWLDERPDVRFLPVDLVNDPAVIARNRKMLSINGALAVDLYGQLAADTIDGQQWSGIGGAEDFVCGASFSEGGHSIVCLPSTANVGGRAISRLVPQFPAGALVTTPRHQVDIVVTEFGAAELAGLTVGGRAAALASIAHPEFRDSLAEAAGKHR